MSRPENPSALHILGFVYLTFAHCTDGELAKEELDAISRVLQSWLPDAPQAVISRVLVESAAWLNDVDTDDARLALAEQYAHLMRQQMSPKQRGAVLVNLIELARADGKVTTREELFIARLTEILDAKNA
ncbi:MAG: TerB family tellurite resistance protein [Nannocystis sp.]|nr:TerB family tellurite resistance protein [Nannocystis sp.]MBA3546813.1 TerB family tellurite resistance protein [Nannocystis sp.]